MVLLLLSYFEEKEESVLFCVEDTCLADEVQLEQVPLTPTIIVCGQSCYSSRRYMLSIDRNLVSTNISSFISALCLMFGSYYNFNIHYPSELASTLEFLQRCFFSINPEKGTKVENKNSRRRLSVNPRVLTLIQDLADHEVVENDRAKILWDFQMQTDKMVVANQPDIVVVDKQKKTAVVIDVAVPNDSNIRKKEHEKLEKYQGLREELERMWRVKVTVVPVVIGALGAVTPKLGEWLQQIPGTTSEISVQKSAVLGTAKILRRTLKLPGLW
ncbi:unnamed protein product [Oreochromis niloticus]|nr:unnamed protein product [Mustela putorius furo]